MHLEHQQQLKQIEQISEQMLELAETSTWQEITPLEKQRKTLIEQFFNQTIDAKDSESIAQVINKVIKLNQKITLILWFMIEK